uniref:AAA+ ATPase domain-containing protein n=1 Tax=viral metagenome TaxID=1070528 RepID=A0A6C0F302_9ZZZZ
MENINKILGREDIANQIKNILNDFDKNCKNVNYNKGIYIYGASGTGKTHFIMKLLEEMNYDIIRYDAGDVRNTSLIDTITSNNMSCRNVLHMMKKSVKKIIIVMDEIDGMNSGDKGGLTSLIKLIRQKKTKKQKLEDVTLNPIICIGNYFLDKKMKELMKVCTVFELKTPTPHQMSLLLNNTLKIENKETDKNKDRLKSMVLEYIQGDLRKLQFIQQLNPDILNETFIENILHIKSHNEDSKKITKHLINQPMSLSEHATFINETDRTIVALLWHENIIDALDKHTPQKTYPFYLRILDNMCFADYIDRITFQYQIWQFNEMSSLMKTFYNNKIYHDTFQNKAKLDEIRFTKVLTKYSTEYNNQQFIYGMCQDLDMDKKDLIAFFQELRIYYGENFQSQAEILNQVEESFENNNVSKLDIKRMYRYLDKNVKKTIADDESVSDE